MRKNNIFLSHRETAPGDSGSLLFKVYLFYSKYHFLFYKKSVISNP